MKNSEKQQAPTAQAQSFKFGGSGGISNQQLLGMDPPFHDDKIWTRIRVLQDGRTRDGDDRGGGTTS